MVSLDGSTRFIGTEFIKLEITGSSNLATEAFVLANGGSGGTSTTDLTNYYNKSETDNLLNNKLNINNPQDMSGTLRIGHVVGTSKIILNAIASDKDFYVSGDAEINGSFLATSIDSSSFVQCADVIASGDVKTDIIDSNGANDLTLKRNTFDICYLKNSSLELNAGINLVAPAQVQANTYNSFDDSSVLLLRNDVEFMRFRKTEDDITISKDVKLLENISLENSKTLTLKNIDTPNGQELEFKIDGVVKATLSTNALLMPLGTEISGDTIYGNSFRARQKNVDTTFYGSNSAGTDKVEYFRFNKTNESVDFVMDVNINSGVKLITDTVSSPDATNLTIERGGSPFVTLTSSKVQLASGISLDGDVITSNSIHGDDCFGNRFRVRHTDQDTSFDGATLAEDGRFTFMVYRHLNEDLRILRDVLIDAGYKISSNVYDSSDNNDVYFKRNDINYIQLGGTALRTRLLTGCQSDIYDSLGNSDATYRRNGIDFFYLKNGNVEMNTNIGLKTDVIDTIGNTNLVIKQNQTAFLTYDKDDANYPDGIVKFDSDVSIATNKYIQCNTIKAHIFDSHPSLTPANDISFRYNGTTYMFYDSSLSNFQVRTDIASNHDITCIALTETSDKRLKTDIDNFHSNCSEIVKKINVKKFKLKDDKKKKTHIGFIADEVLKNTPSDIENIVNTSNDFLSMNYGRMCCLLWKALQETLDRVSKLEEEITEIKKNKPKAKPKAKSKE